MTTYYDEDYNAYTEEDLYDKFYEHIDEVFPTVTIYEVQYYPSNMVGDTDSIDFRELFNNWLNDMQNAGIYTEEAQLDVDPLFEAWIDDTLLTYTDQFDNTDWLDVFHTVQTLYSMGVLELVDGEIQPHPFYTLEYIVKYIADELNG